MESDIGGYKERKFPEYSASTRVLTTRGSAQVTYRANKAGYHLIYRLRLQMNKSLASVSLARSDSDLELAEQASESLRTVKNLWSLRKLHKKNLNGEGTTIAILDGGVNIDHTGFKSVEIDGENFILHDDKDTWKTKPTSHGTTSAYVAARVAPKAKLLMCRVRDDKGVYQYCTIIDCLVSLIGRKESGEDLDVVSMSFGSEVDLACDTKQRTIQEHIRTLKSLGVLCVAASGNYGQFKRVLFPACLDEVISVGALTRYGEKRASNPSTGSIDVYAPGEDIAAPMWEETPAEVQDNVGVKGHNGSSCATPAIAGLIAITLQHHSRSSSRDYQYRDPSFFRHIVFVEMTSPASVHLEPKKHFFPPTGSRVVCPHGTYDSGCQSSGQSTKSNTFPVHTEKGSSFLKYQEVKKNRARLVKQMEEVVSEFAQKAPNDLISGHDRKEACSELIPACDRANLVFEKSLDKIEEDETNFDVFIATLRHIPALKSIADHIVQSVTANDAKQLSSDHKPHGKSVSKVDKFDSGVTSLTAEFSSLDLASNSPRFQQYPHTSTPHKPKAPLSAPQDIETGNFDPLYDDEPATTMPSSSKSLWPQNVEMPTEEEKDLLHEEMVDLPSGEQETGENCDNDRTMKDSPQLTPDPNIEQVISNAQAQITESLQNVCCELRQKEAENNELKKKVEQLSKEKCELEVKLKEAEELIRTKEQDVQQIKIEKDTEIDSLKTKIKTLEGKIAQIEKEKEELKHGREATLQEYAETHKQETKKLRNCLKVANSEKEKAEGELRDMNREVALKNAEKRAEVAEKEVEIGKLANKVKDLQFELWKKDRELETKNKELETKDKELIQKERELAEQKAKTAEEGRKLAEERQMNCQKEFEDYKEKYLTERRMSEQREKHLNDQLMEERRQGAELKEQLKRFSSNSSTNSHATVDSRSSIDSIPESTH